MKKLVSSVLAASMVLSLAACGSSASTDTASSSEAASTSTAATAEAAGEGSGAYTGTPIKIGGIGPVTGGAAVYGQAVKNAEELAVKEINAANGSDVFDWKFEDDEHDAEKSVNAYNTLKDWGLQVLAGPVTTTPSIAVAAETANDNLFMMTPSASAPTVIESGDNVFQICFTDPNQGVNAAKFLAQKYADEKFVLFYNSGDAYSSGIADSFKAQAAESKLEVVDEETFKDDSATSFTNQLTKAKQAGATMIFAPIYYTPASVLLKNAKDMGYDVKMMGCDGMDGILGVEGFDTSLAEGLLLMTPFSADDEKNADFVNAYKDKYGDTPDQFAADAYDGVHAVAEALKEAGLGVDADPTEVADKLSKAMLKITVDGLTGKLTWNDKGQVQKEPTAYVITDGKYVQA